MSVNAKDYDLIRNYLTTAAKQKQISYTDPAPVL